MSTHAIRFYDYHPPTDDFHAQVLAGLAAQPKAIAPKFFYDALGSRLFDAICELAEYYPTRTEIHILKTHAQEITQLIGPDCLLIELGSGSSHKIRLLLEALQPAAYLPLDISREHLLKSARSLAADYPWLEVHATCADYSRGVKLPYSPQGMRKVAFFPGSSIGNFEPEEAKVFLQRIAQMLGPGGALLIGVDIKKDPALLEAAYNDSRGVTAAFNLNLLERINRELDATFDKENFSHQACYNSQLGRIEMYLVSQKMQRVRVDGAHFSFKPAEKLHTENSYKYTLQEFQTLAQRAGFTPTRLWIDENKLFSVHYLEVAAR